MNAIQRHYHVLIAGLLALAVGVSVGMGAPSKKRNPTSKLYVADVDGVAQINTGEKIEDLTKKSVHSAQGTIVETKKDATNAMVFSNGTGIYFDPDTRLEVRKFIQEPFTPNRSDMSVEPSISNTQSFLARGIIGLCTAKLVAGSVMTYRTAQGSISIRGGKVLIESTENQTKVSLLEGDVTVRGGEIDMGGQVLHQGQQAIITPGELGEPASVKVQDIPQGERSDIDKKVSLACMAKNTVYFETADRKSKTQGEGQAPFDSEDTEEVIAIPVVPVELPVNHAISPSRILQPQG